jgi:hypothetical protein
VYKNASGKGKRYSHVARNCFYLFLSSKNKKKTKASVIPTLDSPQLANNITATQKYFASRVGIKGDVWLVSVVSFFMHCVVRKANSRETNTCVS